MVSLGLSDSLQKPWETVFTKVKRAVVFMDAPSAESLHWYGGALKMFEAGALNIKEFSSFEAGSANQKKAVFIVSTLIKGRTADTIKDIIGLSSFQYTVVITAVSHSVHLLANNVSVEIAGRPVFDQFEEKLCEWMGNMNFTTEVMHVPLLLAPLAPHLFLTPSFTMLFPLVPQDLKQINSARSEKKRFTSLHDLDLHSLPPTLQIKIMCLVSSLNCLFEGLSIREECFAVGATSRLIAGELANYPQAKNRRKSAQNRASVVFIDRVLDLTGAVAHHGDNLLEKILSTLPLLPGHTADVKVSMVELSAVQMTDEAQNIIAPGCLAKPNDPSARVLWEAILGMKQKEAIMEIRRHLVEAASKENLPIKMNLGRVSPEQLVSFIHLFKNNFKALESHCGLLQLVLATVQTMKHPCFSRWDDFLAFERLVLQILGESELPRVLRQLLPLVKLHSVRKEEDYSLDDLLILLVYIYSISGEIRMGDELGDTEEELKKALVHAFCAEPELSPLLQKITGCESSSDVTLRKATSVVDTIFASLRDLTKVRAHMKQFRSVYNPGNDVHQASYNPLLKQIGEEILHVDRHDPLDIEHMSAGLSDRLKTGFGMFMKVNRPHPSDHPLLIIFLVGGITAYEMRMLKELVSAQKTAVQVIVLTTKLLKPIDIPELLFALDRLHPDIGV
ncbi:sec1 family domain-containing protein 2 [Protopterus annectens]|uniref:sec1 family domain-containing protein 2 n=1 Tax=Protopterus annectens TaxID=7888 RepID=UPI001CFA2436|nr:sec1 family domain-containing protein 2 [Protopterus annectens]XP_043939112.1 sec1 family domain-containing protein 2 [Protopterus annectens]XP_043939113.1 sec1 family domain-containing protein 2 [Protopterus annectens]